MTASRAKCGHPITAHYASRDGQPASHRGGRPSINNIGLQLRETRSLSINSRLQSLPAGATFGISPKRKGIDWKTFAGLGRKGYANQ
jgi:hypothetical protein